MAKTAKAGTAKLTLPVSERDHTQGPDTAHVTLVEYGDYECPYCGQAYPIIKNIQGRLGDKLCFVFRNFPVTQVHPHAQHSAEAAESAGSQNKFWEMHDYLYEHQQELDDKHLRQYASALDMDVTRFDNEMAKHIHAGRIREDFMSGIRSGVNGTPTFYINGIRHDDSWDEKTLLTAIKDTLANSERRPARRKKRQQQHLVEESKKVMKSYFRAFRSGYRTFFCTPQVLAHIVVPRSLSPEAAIHAGQFESAPDN